jgi:hypothetical protein
MIPINRRRRWSARSKESNKRFGKRIPNGMVRRAREGTLKSVWARRPEHEAQWHSPDSEK